jgi:hypothetical protein
MVGRLGPSAFLRNSAGIVTGPGQTLNIPGCPTHRVLSKIARGLHTHVSGQPPHVDDEVHAFLQPTVNEHILSVIRAGTFRLTNHPDIFACAGGVADDGASIWAMTFFASIPAIVAIIPRFHRAANGRPRSALRR